MKTLLEDYGILTKNLENERSSRHKLKMELAKFHNLKPFVLALIDGDGAIFNNDLLRAGKMGGERAANQLHTDIKRYIEDLDPSSPGANWPIMVQIFANLNGMAKVLRSCRIIDNTISLVEIIGQFNSTQPLFNYVDVGPGKERADHRVRGKLF